MAKLDDTDLDLYLASASPRRRELLNQIGIRFEVIYGLEVDESQHQAESPEQYVTRLACEKALAGYFRIFPPVEARQLAMPPVLGADTCIALDGEILGKPVDRDDGITMLQRLSGRSHKVLTAICLFDRKHILMKLSVIGKVVSLSIRLVRMPFRGMLPDLLRICRGAIPVSSDCRCTNCLNYCKVADNKATLNRI
jgi:MAF protein